MTQKSTEPIEMSTELGPDHHSAVGSGTRQLAYRIHCEALGLDGPRYLVEQVTGSICVIQRARDANHGYRVRDVEKHLSMRAQNSDQTTTVQSVLAHDNLLIVSTAKC